METVIRQDSNKRTRTHVVRHPQTTTRHSQTQEGMITPTESKKKR